MYQEILEKNLLAIQHQKLFYPLDTEVEKAVALLNEYKILTISGLRHTGKTKLIYALLKKTQSFWSCFYYNSDIDMLWVIKNQEDMITLLDIYVRIYGVPKIIVLQNTNNIERIKTFISQLYKTKKYKLIIVGNNIKIEGVPDMEMFPLGIDAMNFPNKDFWGIAEVRIVPDVFYKDFLLQTLKHDIVSRDILEAYTIKNITLFYQVITYIAQIDGYFSLREIHRNLESHGVELSLLTMIDYLNAALNTKLLSRCYLYDLKHKNIITSKIQYFFGDVGVRRAFCTEKVFEENILALEFRRRGYEIFWGLNGRFQFSFRALKEKQEFCVHLETSLDKDTIRKSARKLAKLGDHSQKYIIVSDISSLGMRKFEEDGVKIVDMLGFIKELF